MGGGRAVSIQRRTLRVRVAPGLTCPGGRLLCQGLTGQETTEEEWGCRAALNPMGQRALGHWHPGRPRAQCSGLQTCALPLIRGNRLPFLRVKRCGWRGYDRHQIPASASR